MIVNLLNGRSVAETEAVLKIHNTTVYRILQRFRAYGEAGLEDGRADNGSEKLDDNYLNKLYKVVRATPHKPTAGVGPPGRGNCWWPRWCG